MSEKLKIKAIPYLQYDKDTNMFINLDYLLFNTEIFGGEINRSRIILFSSLHGIKKSSENDLFYAFYYFNDKSYVKITAKDQVSKTMKLSGNSWTCDEYGKCISYNYNDDYLEEK